MKTFPKVPVMLSPFCQDGDKSDDFPKSDSSSTASAITYEKGIPKYYSVPTAAGGSAFTRKQMNRLAYNATVGTFMHELGWPVTFDSSLSASIGGYPMGAVLKWVRLARADGKAMPDGWKFPSGGVPRICDIGDPTVGTVATSETPRQYVTNADQTVSTSDATDCLYVYTNETEEEDTSSSGSWKAVLIDSVAVVVSMVENNTADFRTDGPTWESATYPGNGWAYAAGTRKVAFCPDYSQVTDDNKIYTKQKATSNAESSSIRVETDGWLFVKAVRTYDASGITTLGGFLNVYADGVYCQLTTQGNETPAIECARQFGTGDTLFFMLPVSAGNAVKFVVKNSSSMEISVDAWNVGTVAG